MANGSIATKTADYTLVSMAPDVCWTKVGKSWRPIPYNITHTMDNSENVSPNVFAGGKEAFMHGESFITGVTGDEPGRRGGIVTGTLTEISFGLEKSGSVYVNGKPSVRTGDQVWMNQTTPAAKQGKVGPDKPTSWVKVVATYDDPWKTPIHEAPLILSINGQCVAPMSTLSGGTGHNTTVSSQAMAIQTQEEPGTLVQVGVDPGSVQVVGDTIPGLEDVNRELRFSLESSLDTTYRRVLTSMQEFQAQWDEYGIFSTAISYKDGALAGSELWFDHLADTKKLITETDWQGLSETAYEKVTAGLETAVGSIEDSHKKAANWLIEGAQQEKPWAWFGNQITDASEYAWNAYTNTVEDVADDIADLFKETKEDLESIADISLKLFEHRDDIFLFFQNISSANTSDIANFIDTVIADIDPELARSIKEDTDSYGVFLELINDDAGRIFLSYLGLIIGAVPPNFYAFLYGAAAAYIILEVLFCILLAFISGGLAVAARFAAIIARIAVMGMKVTAVNKRIASGARAVSAYIDSLKVIESSLKQLKAIGANTRRIKLKGQKASGSAGETLVIERKVVANKVRYVDMPKDLAVDPKGVYGYLPTKDSQFHSGKWPVDWTNADQVAKARTTRLDYHVGLNKKQQFIDTLRRDGIGDDNIAKQIVEMRNQERLSHYKTPEALEAVYQRNLTKYGNKSGPTYESQLSKYGSSSEVINAALRSNNTMDILTGISKPKR